MPSLYVVSFYDRLQDASVLVLWKYLCRLVYLTVCRIRKTGFLIVLKIFFSVLSQALNLWSGTVPFSIPLPPPKTDTSLCYIPSPQSILPPASFLLSKIHPTDSSFMPVQGNVAHGNRGCSYTALKMVQFPV